jgi:hypothetical protein
MHWIIGLFGLAFLVAPFLLGYSDNTGALWTSIFIGFAIMVLAWIEGFTVTKRAWEYWWIEAGGLVAIVAPFLFGFAEHTTALWTSVLMGVAVMVLGGYELSSKQFK